jgi:hypothetical protein
VPAVEIPQGVFLRLLWSKGGALHAVNVLGAINPSGVAITQALTNTIGAAIKAAMGSTGLTPQLHTGISLVSVGLRNVNVANQPEFLDSGAAVPGSATGDPLPPQIAFCVTLRTALAGRSYRGRVYLQGYTEASSDTNGNPTAGTGSVGVAFITAIGSTLTANNLTLAVLSRANPNKLPPKAAFGTAVTAIVNRDLIWDTQRRRASPGI